MPNRHPEATCTFATAVLRRFVLAVVLVAVVLSCIVASLYVQDSRYHQARLEQEGAYLVSLQQEFISLEFRAVQSDLLYLARQEPLQRFLAGEDAARAFLENEYVKFARSKTVYDQIRYLDTSGQEIVRVNYRDGDVEIVPNDELQTKAKRYYYERGLTLNQSEVFVSSFDLNVEHERIQQPIKPVIRFLTPVFDASGEKRGLMVLNYMGSHLLTKLKEISAGFHGRSMLVNHAGQYLLAPDPNHEWGWVREDGHNFQRHFPRAWNEGKGLVQGHVLVDRDLFTFRQVTSPSPVAAARGVQPSENTLLLVSHIPATVAVAHSRKTLRNLLWMYSGTLVLVMVLSYFWARSRVAHDYQEQRLAESESRLRVLSSRLLAAQEDERRRLSRDLHDELGQQITAISLDLQTAVRANVGEPARSVLRRAVHEIGVLLTSLHDIASRVRPTVLDDLGLQDAVESYISEYQQRTEIATRCELRLHRTTIPAVIRENVYRVLQEALANVAAHARTRDASVTLEVVDHVLHMTVWDGGIGFEPERARNSSRLGLLGMRERIELLNGTFEISSAPGQGTRIHVEVPLTEESQRSLPPSRGQPFVSTPP